MHLSLKITWLYTCICLTCTSHALWLYWTKNYECWLCTNICPCQFSTSLNSSRGYLIWHYTHNMCSSNTRLLVHDLWYHTQYVLVQHKVPYTWFMDTKGAWSHQTFWINKSTSINRVKIGSMENRRQEYGHICACTTQRRGLQSQPQSSSQTKTL